MSRKNFKRKEVSSAATCAVFDRCNSIHFCVADFVLCLHKWQQTQAFLLQQLKWKTFLFLKLKAFLTSIYHTSPCWQWWCKWHRKIKWTIYGHCLWPYCLPIMTATRHCWAEETRKPWFLGKDKADGVHLFPPKTAKRVSLFFMDVWFCTASGCLTSLSSLDLCKVLFPSKCDLKKGAGVQWDSLQDMFSWLTLHPWSDGGPFPGEFEGFLQYRMTHLPLYVVVSPLVRCLAETFSSLSQEEISFQLGNLFPVKLNRRIRFPERACGCNKGLLTISLAVHTELGTQVANFVCPKLHNSVYANVRVQSPHWAGTRFQGCSSLDEDFLRGPVRLCPTG